MDRGKLYFHQNLDKQQQGSSVVERSYWWEPGFEWQLL